MHLILASASPRRAELLSSAGFEFEAVSSNIDETPLKGEAPGTYTLRVAREKARHVGGQRMADGVAVIAADTEVVAHGRIFGKPADEADARRMLRLLSGITHDVLTGLVLLVGRREVAEVVTTRVQFMPLSEEEIDWYVQTGEPMGKAGAYAIQGCGARFVERIDGSWSNVVGLPVATVHRLLREVEWAD